MLAWWVITAVCFGIRSGIKSDWNLIFLYSGVLTVLPALWFTFVVVICGIPVVVAKLPEPWRPLSNVIAFLVWASLPLCLYTMVHPEEQIRLGGILNYPGIHGYFMASLFALGLYAFGIGRRKSIPSHRAIQPYILIPILILIAIGTLGSMDVLPRNSDYATLDATGLTPALVWYFWSVASVSVCFLLGHLKEISALKK